MSMLAASPAATLPRIGEIARHAVPRIIETMIMPVAVFYLGLLVTDLMGAIAISAAWVYGGLLLRLVRRRAVPGSVILAVIAITVRVALAVLMHDERLFFLPPTLGVFSVSVAFLVSAGTRRPLAERMAADLVPLPAQVVEHLRERNFYRRQSLIWGIAQLGNGLISLWLLYTLETETYVLVRAVAVAVLLGGAVAGVLVDYLRSTRVQARRPSTRW